MIPAAVSSLISPSFAVGQGHFLCSTTHALAVAAISALNQQDDVPDGAEPGLTEEQDLSLIDLCRFFEQFRPELERGIAEEQSLSAPEARREVDLLLRLLEQLGRARAQSRLERDRFEYRLSIGAPESQKK